MKLRKYESSRARVEGARLTRESWTCFAHSPNRVFPSDGSV